MIVPLIREWLNVGYWILSQSEGSDVTHFDRWFVSPISQKPMQKQWQWQWHLFRLGHAELGYWRLLWLMSSGDALVDAANQSALASAGPAC